MPFSCTCTRVFINKIAHTVCGSCGQGLCSNVRTLRRVLRGGVRTGLEVLEQEVLEQGAEVLEQFWAILGAILGRIAPQNPFFTVLLHETPFLSKVFAICNDFEVVL